MLRSKKLRPKQDLTLPGANPQPQHTNDTTITCTLKLQLSSWPANENFCFESRRSLETHLAEFLLEVASKSSPLHLGGHIDFHHFNISTDPFHRYSLSSPPSSVQEKLRMGSTRFSAPGPPSACHDGNGQKYFGWEMMGNDGKTNVY